MNSPLNSVRRPLAAALLALASCAGTTLIPEPQRVQLQDDLAGHVRYLRVSCYVTPFYRDAGKLLLTDQSPDEIDQIDQPNGQPMNPGAPLQILPAGTRLRIEKVSFPTAFEVTSRVLLTPRYNPWVLLFPPDDFAAQGQPYVLVLHPNLTTHDEFLQELGRYLTTFDPSSELQALPQPVQRAIAEKQLLAGMTTHDVERAWGYPERIHLDGATHTQRWLWPEEKQKAWFNAETLVGWDDHGTLGGHPPVGG